MTTRARQGRGQGLIEFALVIPLFLAMLIAVFDFGRVVWASDSLNSAAREAARFAIVHGGSALTACPIGPAAPDAIIPTANASCPYPSPSKEAIRDVARAAALAGGTTLTVTVCYSAPAVTPCVGDTDTPGATNARGQIVSVAITSNLGLIVPSLVGFSSIAVDGTSSMIVNH